MSRRGGSAAAETNITRGGVAVVSRRRAVAAPWQRRRERGDGVGFSGAAQRQHGDEEEEVRGLEGTSTRKKGCAGEEGRHRLVEVLIAQKCVVLLERAASLVQILSDFYYILLHFHNDN